MTWNQKIARQWMKDHKDRTPCVDCSARAGYPVFYRFWVLEYDHLPGTKCRNLGTEGRKLTEAELMYEVAKCDVVCANCHKERTHFRQIQPRKPKW